MGRFLISWAMWVSELVWVFGRDSHLCPWLLWTSGRHAGYWVWEGIGPADLAGVEKWTSRLNLFIIQHTSVMFPTEQVEEESL